MHIDKNNSLLDIAHYTPSPNFNERPQDAIIDLIVIHSIDVPPQCFGDGAINALFTNQLNPQQYPHFAEATDLQVSAHILINRLGKMTQYVPFSKRAWHAGASQFAGRENCNDFSVGIELEGAKDINFTDEQYQRLRDLIFALKQCYPNITDDRIVGHCDVAPGRKTDPGPLFEWNRLHNMIKCYSD